MPRPDQAYFHVADYGAIGDGVVDDTRAIQNAINAASYHAVRYSCSAEVDFGYGIFSVSDTIYVREHNIHLTGCGGSGDWWTPFGTTLVPTADFPDGQYVLDYDHSEKSTSLYGNRLRGIAIFSEEEDFPFDNTVHGLKWGVAKGIAYDVYIQGMSGHGMGIAGHSTEFKAYDSRFVNCNFRKNGTNGIEYISSNSDLWFLLCKSEGNVDGAGIYGLGANCYYVACHFTGNKNNVANKSGSTESVWLGCNFEGPSQHNVYLDTTVGAISRARFIGCHFNSNRLDADNTWDAIYIGRDSGSFTCSGLAIGNTFAATLTNKPRYHINLSDAAAFSFMVDDNTYGSSSTAHVNHNSAATRCLVNGLGINSGNPTTTGDWNGNGVEGSRVYDTSGGAFYTYVQGAWVAG